MSPGQPGRSAAVQQARCCVRAPVVTGPADLPDWRYLLAR